MEEPMTYPSATGIVSVRRYQRLVRVSDGVRLTGNTVSTVDNDTRQVPLVYLAARPRGRERQHGLHGDIPDDVEP